MQFQNHAEGRAVLKDVVASYFQDTGKRTAINFLDSEDEDFFYAHFLIASRHVMRYGIGMDRRTSVGGISVAIGPHYFALRSLVSDQDASRLSIELSISAIQKNLAVLDGYLAWVER
jgi:hypothetical protein